MGLVVGTSSTHPCIRDSVSVFEVGKLDEQHLTIAEEIVDVQN